MPVNANAQLTKLAVSILGVAALAGIAGRLSSGGEGAPPVAEGAPDAAFGQIPQPSTPLWNPRQDDDDDEWDDDDDDDEWDDDDGWEMWGEREDDEDEWREHRDRARFFMLPPNGEVRRSYTGRARSGHS